MRDHRIVFGVRVLAGCPRDPVNRTFPDRRQKGSNDSAGRRCGTRVPNFALQSWRLASLIVRDGEVVKLIVAKHVVGTDS